MLKAPSLEVDTLAYGYRHMAAVELVLHYTSRAKMAASVSGILDQQVIYKHKGCLRVFTTCFTFCWVHVSTGMLLSRMQPNMPINQHESTEHP